MKGFHLSKTKFLLAASAASFMLALGCNPSTASAAGEEALKVTYDTLSDCVDVGDYKFYTTSKPGKTAAPATNCWIRTTGGTVSLSNIPNATTLYFADSTSPAVEDIVSVSIPALPKISSVKYYPVELDKAMKTDASANSGADYKAALRKAFIFNTSVKCKEGTKVKTVSVRIDPTLVQVKFNDNSAWQDFDTAMTQANLKGILADGATMYARIKPSGTQQATTVDAALPKKETDPQIYSFASTHTLKDMFKDAKGGAFSDTNILSEGLVRYGLPKAFKIPRLAAAPAVSVDYANHVITLKKGMNYKTAVDWTTFDKPETKYQDKALDATKKISLGDVAGIYAVRLDATEKKAESLENYIVIPATEKLATDSGVMITGTDGQNATLTIVDREWNIGEKDEDKKKTLISKAYQYAIIKAADIDKVITKGASGKTATFKYDTDVKIAWKTVKTSAKTGMAKATLSWKTANDCYVVVRKAADVKKKVFSSEVEVFKAPKAEETAVNVWEKLTLTDYADKGFTSNDKAAKAPFATVEYKGDKVFEITLLNSKVAKLPTAEGEKFTAKIGKDVKTVALADSSKDITSGKVSVKVDGITEADAVTATFTLPAPADATKADDTKYVAFAPITQTLKVDTKASKVESMEAKDGKFTMVVAGDVALAGSDGKLAIASGSKALADLGITGVKIGGSSDSSLKNLNVSYNAKTKKTTFTGEYTSTAASGQVELTFATGDSAKMKDMGGNLVDTTKNTGSYTKKEEASSGS